MFESFKLFLIFVAIIVLTINNLEIEADQEVDYFTTANSLGVEPERCDVCDLNNCPVPTTECLAGLVKDHCDCCFQCARREGERCFDERFKEKLPDDYERYPKCGDDLQCEIRTDLEENDRPEAICYCRYNDPICGSDGISYENQCQFTEARYRNRKLFEIDNRPCKSSPKIISPPEDTTNNTDSSVAFFCEATGWPIPEIGWKFELDGVEQSIPLSKAIENNRFEIKSNESSKYTAISWLQIVETNRNDSGNYICVATNSEGSDKAKAYLTIGNFQKKFDPID